jgi:hypothetical protein
MIASFSICGFRSFSGGVCAITDAMKKWFSLRATFAMLVCLPEKTGMTLVIVF